MELKEGDYLQHYGILRKSGRYPWGSGKSPLQRSRTFLDIVKQHEQNGLKPAEIAKLYSDPPEYKFTTTDLRAAKSHAVNIQKQDQIRTAQRFADKGMGASAIGREMGVSESTVRSLLAPGRKDKLDILQKTTEMLKRQVDEKGFIDVGAQVERSLPLGDHPDTHIPISKDKFNTALSMLKEEGYSVVTVPQPQLGTGETTTRRVLGPPGTTQRDAFLNRDKIQLISEKTNDGGRSWQDASFKQPLNIDPKRIGIRYKEDGGADADGVIYVRPGVPDIELGKNQYAQVRIAVGGTHYLKGMAVYKDDLPQGVDLLFNTNKSNTGSKLDALKKLETTETGEVDWKNPFGSFPKLIGGQILGEDGKPTSAMNILTGEGDWGNWSRNLSRQMLSKQDPEFARAQLGLAYATRQKEFDEIRALTNPVIKRRLLEAFADETDSSSVYLKAAAIPRQATKAILPVTSLKPDEIFAPTFRDGERVALVRFPHAGRFEIPELTVNNRNREANSLFAIGKGGTAPDAVGIHPKVAEKLSGADFDGDTVVVIPNNRGLVKSRPALEGLKDFDPHTYKVPTPDEDPANGWLVMGDKKKSDRLKQSEMGRVTNLISDMTLMGANDEELARAVRHSMVVIDAVKHNLDYKASERDNQIIALKRKYQGVNERGQPRGASTLITRTTARDDVAKRKPAKAGPGLTRLSKSTFENETGQKVWEPTGETDKQGNIRTFRSKKGAETDNAYTLVPRDRPPLPIEQIYADHANKLKAMANDARKEYAATTPKKKNPSAAEVYKDAVESLDSKLNIALMNSPLERQAQSLAALIVGQRRQENPNMDESTKKKIRGQALEQARARVGAKKDPIVITDREWDAIQAGAISSSKLKDILNNTDVDKLRERATPRQRQGISPALLSWARSMLNTGATYAQVAESLNVPVSTLQSNLKREAA